MYRTKQYAERPLDELKTEIDLISAEQPWTRSIFLADGDALNLQTNILQQILEYLYLKFKNLERVSCYAMPKNLLQKKDTDLQLLREAGLTMLYVGIESGNDVVLEKITKGATQNGIVQSCKKAKKHGFTLSCMIILGIGGKTYSRQHMIDTARMVSKISPDYLAALTLHILEELDSLIRELASINPVLFRANHASNIYSIGGTIPQDRDRLLALVDGLKHHPEMLRDKSIRRF